MKKVSYSGELGIRNTTQKSYFLVLVWGFCSLWSPWPGLRSLAPKQIIQISFNEIGSSLVHLPKCPAGLCWVVKRGWECRTCQNFTKSEYIHFIKEYIDHLYFFIVFKYLLVEKLQVLVLSMFVVRLSHKWWNATDEFFCAKYFVSVYNRFKK